MNHTFTVSETVRKEVTVNLPCYRKYKKNCFYLVISKDEMIQVHTYETMACIQESFSINVAFDQDTEESTHAEFWRAYQLASRRLEAKACFIKDWEQQQ